MRHALKFCIVISAVLAMSERSSAQCFVCSDGNHNTAVGTSALTHPTGADNTGIGFSSLAANTTGAGNTASGYQALFSNITGNYNTAIGYQAFFANTGGNYTTAVGANSLAVNTTGTDNTAFGAYALASNTTGQSNNASGDSALFSNSTGNFNSAMGLSALQHNTTGSGNAAFGLQALYSNTTGSNNIGIGNQAGYFANIGSNNIEIGALGSASDNGKIRIGVQGTQTTTYVAGISGAQITGAAVYVSSTGQLGVLASSERYKTGISPIGLNADKLNQLRPVSFHLKTDPNGTVQYGLIAEEVDKVYPELVIHDAAGKVQGVRYEELTPMLLNEVQQLRQEMTRLKRSNESMRASMARLTERDISGARTLPK